MSDSGRSGAASGEGCCGWDSESEIETDTLGAAGLFEEPDSPRVSAHAVATVSVPSCMAAGPLASIEAELKNTSWAKELVSHFQSERDSLGQQRFDIVMGSGCSGMFSEGAVMKACRALAASVANLQI
jgi:hypothetical protein